MNSADNVKYGDLDIFYDLAKFLSVDDPDEGIDPFDPYNQEIDYSGWLETTLWNALEEGKAVFPREMKVRLLTAIYYCESYLDNENVRNRWDPDLDRLRAVEPIVSDDEIDAFYEKHPEVVFPSL